ncbi:Ribonuclease kappa-B [Halotydeus destructor]|nr:Ribonuclease kappa-B [Halotydeus destructor]
MAFLGPKLSLFFSILSVWGVIMLSIMGGLLSIKSVAFAEDFQQSDPEPENLTELYKMYDDAAMNCWIACGLYGITLVVSVQQFYSNLKSN